MSTTLHVPILSELVPNGFRYGANYLVEFEPSSLWYEASLSIAAQALKSGVKVHYHTFMHIPSEVREELEKLGTPLNRLQSEDKFRLIDSFTPLTGLPIQPEHGTLWSGERMPMLNDPSYLEKYTAVVNEMMARGASDADQRWLHVDDNTSIFNRYFREEDVLNLFNTRVLPEARILKLSMIHSVVSGVFSKSFYRQFEAQCDGVIDFKSEEGQGRVDSLVRVRHLRGMECDSSWRKLRMAPGGIVELDPAGLKASEKSMGISGWLKGPKKK